MRVRSLFSALRVGASAVVLFSVVAAPIAQTSDPSASPITPAEKTEVLDKVTEVLTHQAYVPTIDFDKWPDFMQGEKPKLDAATSEEDYARALNEALNRFGASHINLQSPRAAEARRDAAMVGIGISQQPTKDGVLVLRVVSNAPAAEAGIVPGDLITMVDGHKIDALRDGAKGIPGKEGTQVKLTVKHESGKTEEYTLTRRKFSTVRPEEFSEVNKDTAKVTIHTFDWTYRADNVESIMQKADAYRNLIVDLRGNGGGAVLNLQHLLGLLVPSDESFGTFVTKDMVNAYVRDTHGKPSEVAKIAEWSRGKEDWDIRQIRPIVSHDLPTFRGNIVVLVDAGSGSASEIVAAALHDLVDATIVGQKSAGAVLVSTIVPATNGFTLQFPLMDYVTVKGVRLEGNGVVPDVQVTQKGPLLPGQTDEAVSKAVSLFAKDRHDTKDMGTLGQQSLGSEGDYD
jgi:carboxyl-terminal processing protease